MQWNCPHCGILLAISDDTMGTGWSFSRCYKCGGFALIRRTEVNVIKVDKAPLGERVILPEASHNPSIGLMSEGAIKNFSRHFSQAAPNSSKGEKPIVRPAGSSQRTAVPPPPPSALLAGKSSQAQPSQTSNNPEFIEDSSPDFSEQGLPLPLPELPNSPRNPGYRVGIAAASTAAVISGIFLYIQAQTVAHRSSPVITDRVEQSAMAPRLTPEPPSPALAPTSASPPMAATVSGKNRGATAPDVISPPPLESTSVASVGKVIRNEALHSPIDLKVRVRQANLHTGPGIGYPIIGSASIGSHFQTSEWSDRWFKVAFQKNDATTDYGWVRNDLVQVISH